MGNGQWATAKQAHLAHVPLPFAIQDALFSILLTGARMSGDSRRSPQPAMDFLEEFERATLPGLPHADHVRVACAYLDRYGEADTLERLLAGLARFAAAKGKPDKFHYTMTRAWLELIVDARRRHPTARTADDLMRACPALGDSST
ncbi:MAG TPA: hypothetical protein VLD67_06505, partial [Vicinamibacterales bacterium]|nr:hypothetical protein [Vicinamibacterales bacterium]